MAAGLALVIDLWPQEVPERLGGERDFCLSWVQVRALNLAQPVYEQVALSIVEAVTLK